MVKACHNHNSVWLELNLEWRRAPIAHYLVLKARDGFALTIPSASYRGRVFFSTPDNASLKSA